MPPRRTGFKKSRNGCDRCKARRVKVRHPRSLFRVKAQIPVVARGSTNTHLQHVFLHTAQCDEQRPCANCALHGVTCSLGVAFPRSEGSSRRLAPAESTGRDSPAIPAVNGRPSTTPVASGQTKRIIPQIQSESITAKAAGVTKLFEELAGKIEQMSEGETATQDSKSNRDKSLSLASQEKQDWLRDFQLVDHYLTSLYETLSWEPSTHHIWRDTVIQLALSHVSKPHARTVLFHPY